MSDQTLRVLQAYDSGDTSLIDEQIVSRYVTTSSVAAAIQFLEENIKGGCKTSAEVMAHILSCTPDCVSGEDNLIQEYRYERFSNAYDSLCTGEVYVLVNKHMPGLLKIGFTTQDIRERVKQLSASTGVPVAYKSLFTIKTIYCQDAEAIVHKVLNKYRVNESREFFQCPAMLAAEVCEKAVLSIHKQHGIALDGHVLRDESYFPDQDYARNISERFDTDPDEFFAEQDRIERPF